MKLDYENMFFPVMEYDSTDYEGVLAMPEFEGIEINRLHGKRLVATVKYLALLYGKGSPIIERYAELEKRREKALQLSGLNTTKNSDYLEEVKNLDSKDLVIIVAQMLRKQGEHELTLLLTQEHFMNELTMSMLDTIIADDDKDKMMALERKGKLSSMMEDVVGRINKFRSQYFKDDKVLERKVRSLSGFTPETMAKFNK